MTTTKPIYLASASPRRREIMEKAGYQPEIISVNADESTVAFTPGDPCSYVKMLAKLKNDAAYELLKKRSNGLLLTADTVVCSSDFEPPLGKPHDKEDAVRMLHALSGNVHRVITGVMLRNIAVPSRTSLFSVTTEVHFCELSDEEIYRYCDSGEPYDKAGGYGIQGAACIFVKQLVGDYYNVVGLPICRVHEEIVKMLAE